MTTLYFTGHVHINGVAHECAFEIVLDDDQPAPAVTTHADGYDLSDRPEPAHGLPPEREPHPGRVVTMEMLDRASTDAERWALLIERFPDLTEELESAAKANGVKKLPAVSGSAQEQAQEPESDLETDLATIADIADELVEDGELVWGGQTRIAEALGVVNGGAHRDRILAVVEALQANSTTTTAENGVENGVEAQNGREAA